MLLRRLLQLVWKQTADRALRACTVLAFGPSFSGEGERHPTASSWSRLRPGDGHDAHAQVRFYFEADDVACALLRAPDLGHLQRLHQLVAHLLHPQPHVGIADRAEADEHLLAERVRMDGG